MGWTWWAHTEKQLEDHIKKLALELSRQARAPKDNYTKMRQEYDSAKTELELRRRYRR